MNGSMKWAVVAALALGGVGCHDYNDERPDVNSIDSRDKGLQSKEVIDSTDQMAASILGDPDLNNKPTQLMIVVGNIKDATNNSGARTNLDIFLRRLKVILQQKGRGRITLIVNKAELEEMQSKELDLQRGASDEFGQGGNPNAGKTLPGRHQPDYMLNGQITELNNRGTSYFFLEAKIFGLKGPDSGIEVWNGGYEVKVAK